MSESPANKPAHPHPYRVLLILPNWLGDAVMATGLLGLLHQAKHTVDGPHLHLTLGVRRAWLPLFESDPRIDDLLVIERKGRHGGWQGFMPLVRDMAEGKFQAVVLGPPSLRVAAASLLAGIPLRTGYRSDGRGALLNGGLPAKPRGEIHYFQEMLNLGQKLLIELGLSDAPLKLPSTTSLPGCQEMPAEASNPNYPRWILAPGATYGLAKTWPLEPAVQFSRLALDKNVELVLLGDAGASGFAQDLGRKLDVQPRGQLQGTPGLTNLTGKTTLPQVVGIMKSSQAFVGNDSGLMHLAGALELPTLGIFGSSNTRWTSPVGPVTCAVAAQGFECQPCYRKTCNQPQFCLDTIDGQQVFKRLNELLTQASASGGSV